MEVRTAPVTSARFCRCVKDHNPDAKVVHSHHVWPLGHGGPDEKWNLVWLCPTGHYNVHYVLDYMLKHGGAKPPGRHNAYQLELAMKGYDAIKGVRA